MNDTCGSVTVTWLGDVTNGACPRTVTRSYRVTDACSNSVTCVQTFNCVCPVIITDTILCTLPTNYCNGTGPQFRLLFTQDPQNFPCYKVTSSNPGQFYYNTFYVGTPGSIATFTITLPYPWVTQGAQPIHAYDGVTTSTSGGVTCFTPGNVIFVNSTQVTLMNYSPKQFGSTTTLSVAVTVPASGFVYLNVHLDYGLKATTGYTQDAYGNATACTNTAIVLIPNNRSFVFAIGGSSSGSQTVTSCNAFKKNPGVGGLVQSLASSDSVPGATAILKDSKGSQLASGLTDADGWYVLNYKWTGPATTFYVTTTIGSGKTAWTQTKAITLKANAYVETSFISP